MQISAPKMKYEINLNTIILVLGLAGVTAGWGAVWGQTTFKIDREISDRQTWVANHEQLHKDRLAQVSAIEARTDQRLQTLETNLRKVENLEYRITVQEQGSQNLTRSVEELKATVNNLGTDIRVIREIVERDRQVPAR